MDSEIEIDRSSAADPLEQGFWFRRWGRVGPTDDVRVTLYTCEGSFNWGTRRYSHYRVVVARFVEAAETGQEPIR